MKNETVAEFLARGGRIAKGPTAEANATPLRVLRKQAERNADAGLGYCVRAYDAERADERRREIYGAAREGGASVSDALDESNDIY